MSLLIPPPTLATYEKNWAASSGSSGAATSLLVYVPSGALISSSIGASPIQAQVSTKLLRAKRFSMRQTPGTNTGIIRYYLYKNTTTPSGVYFDVAGAASRESGPVVGTYDFDPTADELIMFCQVITGTVTNAPTRIGITVSFEEVAS